MVGKLFSQIPTHKELILVLVYTFYINTEQDRKINLFTHSIAQWY